MSKRKKIILSIIAFIILIGVGIFSWAIYTDRVFLGASGKQYSAKFVKQEPKGEINLKKGELKRFSIEFKNTGRITWKNYGNQGVYLVDAKDKISNFWVPNNDFYQKVNQYKLGSGWLNPFRITFLQNSVKSQQTATFTFFIQAPFKKGEYQEGFKLVDASGKQVNNSKTAIKFNVIDEIMIEKINKNSAIYQEIKDKLGDIDMSEEVAKLKEQVEQEQDPVKKSELLTEIASLEKEENIEGAIGDLEKAKEEVSKIEDTKQKEEITRSLDKEIEKLGGEIGSEEPTEEVGEAKTVQSPQVSGEGKVVEHRGLKIGGVTAGSMAGGAAIGAGVGSVVPGVGTGIGAIGGGIIGGLVGLIGGLFGF